MALSETDLGTMLDVARIAVAIVVLGVASWTDVRTRKVPNAVWYAAAAAGIVILLLDLEELPDGLSFLGWTLLAFPLAAVFAVTVTGGELWPVMPEDEEDPGRELTPREARVYVADMAVSAVLIVASVAILVLVHGKLETNDRPMGPFWSVVSAVLMIAVALGLYLARLIHGGGDAKALMTLAVIFPAYPALAGMPLLDVPAGMELLFPFAITVLIDAAIITAITPLGFLAVSAYRGSVRLPEALFGYPVPVDEVEGRHLWLMYETAEGSRELRRRLWPRRSKAAEDARARALEVLRERGDAKVYVSPKIPFMVPLLVGLLLAVTVGNVVTGLIWALVGL